MSKEVIDEKEPTERSVVEEGGARGSEEQRVDNEGPEASADDSEEFEAAWKAATTEKPEADDLPSKDEDREQETAASEEGFADKQPSKEEEPRGAKTKEEDPKEAELRALQQKVASWEGRLSASDRQRNELAQENARLKAELEAARKGGDGTANSDAGKGQPPDGKGGQGAKGSESEEGEQDAIKALASEYGDDEPVVRALTAIEKKLAAREAADRRRVEEAERQAALERQLAPIREAHPDVDSYTAETQPGNVWSSPLGQWLASLGDTPEGRYNRYVYLNEGGQAAIDLLGRYKEAKGITPGGNNGAGTKKRDRSQEAEVVDSRGGVIPRSKPDMNDFEGAWSEATRNYRR